MKRILTLSLVLVLVVSLLAVTGCAAPTPTPTPSPVPTATPIPKVDYGASLTYEGKLTYLIWGGDIDVKQEQAKADLFTAKYPKITVEIVQQNGAWPDILAAHKADGTFPDLFWNPDVGAFVTSDYAADISMFKDDVDYGVWNAALVKAANYGGFQAAMPIKYFTSGVYINKTLLEQNNIDMPSLDWSVADFTQITKDLAAVGGDFRAIGWPLWNSLFCTPDGIDRAIREGKDYDFGTAENIALQTARQEQWKYSNDHLKTVDTKDYGFDGGKVGMIDDMSWGIGWYALQANDNKGLPFEWDYYPLPSLEAGGKQYQLAVSDFLSISNIAMSDGDRAVSDTEKAKLTAAYVLMKYLTINEEGYMESLALGFNSLPVFQSDAAITAFKATYKIPGKPGYTKVLEMMNDPDLMVAEPNKFVPGTSSAFWDKYYNVLLGNDADGKPWLDNAGFIANLQQKAGDANTQAKQAIADASAALIKALKDNWNITWSPAA
jgi:multiple sugar transport system substrate-binding protein